MQTHRFLIKKEDLIDQKFSISDADTINKILRVLRLIPGTDIELFDGAGGLYKAKITDVSETLVAGDILSESVSTEDDHLQVILAQGIPKGSKLDDIVRMNTEVGVSKFVLFEAQHSVLKKDDIKDKKIERLYKIVQEAARQSERVIIPEIVGPLSFDEMLDYPADYKLLLHSRVIDRSIDIKDLNLKGTILVVVGPEGGFSPEELEKTKRNDFAIVHMNLSILRTETAGIVASAILLS